MFNVLNVCHIPHSYISLPCQACTSCNTDASVTLESGLGHSDKHEQAELHTMKVIITRSLKKSRLKRSCGNFNIKVFLVFFATASHPYRPNITHMADRALETTYLSTHHG